MTSGDSVSLFCVTNATTSVLTWLHQGQEISLPSAIIRVEITLGGVKTSYLEISSAEAFHSGIYTCILSTSESSTVSTTESSTVSSTGVPAFNSTSATTQLIVFGKKVYQLVMTCDTQ